MQFDDEDGKLSRFIGWGDLTLYPYQSVSPFPLSEIGTLSTEARLRPAAMLVLSREAGQSPSDDLVLVKSHHSRCAVNGISLWNPAWVDRVVNPVRDPREVCCSFADHLGKSYEETAELMNDPSGQIGGDEDTLHHVLTTWSGHVRSWIEYEEVPVHTVRYEYMKTDPVEAFYGIFEFLDAPDLSKERVRQAVEKTQFEKLKEAEEKREFTESTDHQDNFFRSGELDGWKDELPFDLARKIEEDHGEVMEALGYL
ncbi:hypothetical protein GGP98_002134 [Salinibacter ruber]|nr:hypothetical protein [Salinibacter ruber]